MNQLAKLPCLTELRLPIYKLENESKSCVLLNSIRTVHLEVFSQLISSKALLATVSNTFPQLQQIIVECSDPCVLAKLTDLLTIGPAFGCVGKRALYQTRSLDQYLPGHDRFRVQYRDYIKMGPLAHLVADATNER